MADGNKIARRSARVFTEDEHTPHPENASNEPITRSRRNTLERVGKQHEKTSYHTRNSSSSSLPIMDIGKEYLGGSRDAAQDNVETVTESLKAAKQATEKIAGRPLNFGLVIPGIFRSSFPQSDDHEYLKTLGLKTVVTLVQKDYPEGFKEFVEGNGIKHIIFDMQGTKKVPIPQHIMEGIMEIVLNAENYPILLHCNHGKHRTGCVVAVIRKVTGWGISSIVEEYNTYAAPKEREADINYINDFKIESLDWILNKPRHEVLSRTSRRKWSKIGSYAIVTMCCFGYCVLTFWVTSYQVQAH